MQSIYKNFFLMNSSLAEYYKSHRASRTGHFLRNIIYSTEDHWLNPYEQPHLYLFLLIYMGESTVLSIILRLFLFLDFIFFQKQTERLVFAVVWPAVGCRLSIATRAASCRVGSESWELLLTFLFGGQRGPPCEKKKMRKRYIERKIESAVWRRVTSSNCMV